MNGTNYSIAVGRVNPTGLWDNSFDSDGIAITSGNLVVRDLVLQPDGKAVIAGHTNGSNEDFMLARYTTTGSLDGTFGSGGIIITPVGTSHEAITNVALQADGKIIAAGHSINASTSNDFSVARYNTNGSLDTSFGVSGIVKTIFGNGNDIAGGLALQTDGKIVVGGYTNNGANNDFAMARYLAGADCTYSISPTNSSITAAAASGSFNVTTNETYCTWTAVSNAAWITVTGGASGTGNGTVNYSVAANTGAARTGTITAAGQTFTINQAAAVDVSMPTNIQSLKNAAVVVPINVSDTTGKGIISFDFTVTYDAAALTPMNPAYDNAGTLSSSFTITPNAGAGQVRISGYHTAAMAGAGAMINLKFTATGNPQTCSALVFSSFTFNDGNPAAATSNGQVCIINGSVAGTVTNPNTATGAAVPGVTLTVTGGSAFSTVTDASGAYLLEGFGNGNYTVTPSKTGDTGDAISSLDASLIARYAVQLETLNANQLIAADVSGNSGINSFDAALVAQYLVNIANPGNAGTWKFAPVSRSYTDLISNQIGENYDAILMGDVTGNWTAPNPFAGYVNNENQIKQNAVTVNLPNGYAPQGQIITVPVTVGDTSSQGILAYDFALQFNSSVLRLDSIEPVNKTGTVSSQFTVTANPDVSSRLLVSAFGVQPLAGTGTLLNLRFRVIGQAGDVSPLTWERFKFNEDQSLSNARNGQLQVVAPTAANVSIGGRVLTASGQGISNTTLILTDSNGNRTVARTSSFGYYNFENVAVGETYVISIFSKRFIFDQPVRAINVTEQLTDIDFVARED